VSRYRTIWLFGHLPKEMDFVSKSLANYFILNPLDREFVVFYDPCEIINSENQINTPNHYLIVCDLSLRNAFRKKVRAANNDILWVYFDTLTHKQPEFEDPTHEELEGGLILPCIIEPYRKKGIILFNFVPWFGTKKP
jgi:hypothetical protein